MQSRSGLEERFGIPGVLRFDETPGGLVQAVVSSSAAQAEVYLQGAHVARWTPRGQRPVLFLSERSEFLPGKAIRGGVPVIFPWFGPWLGTRGGGLPRPSHGFARTSIWTLEETTIVENGSAETVPVTMLFSLEPDSVSRDFGYGDFRLRYRVTMSARLELELEVSHNGSEPFTYEEALHSYFAVADIGQVGVAGLAGTTYIDKTDGNRRKVQQEEPLRFSGETDQVHLHTEANCVIYDAGWERRIAVEKSGSASTVVWNPWAEKTLGLKDMEPDAWRGMVCVETANVADDAVTLPPGASHTMRTIIRIA
jgi:glucose-6-phosphate 1-epimerase